MKKLFSLLLAAAMILSLAACGSKADDNNGGDTAQPADALALLNAVWSSYAEDDKFAVSGGDMNEENMVDDAPGNFSVADGDALDYSLGYPAADADKLADAASLTHMMNANTFTAGAYHLSDKSDMNTVVSDLKDNIMSRQWMCGFPDKLVIATLGNYVVSVYGDEELVNTFRDKLQAAYSDAAIAYDEMIGEGEFSDGEDTALEAPVA